MRYQFQIEDCSFTCKLMYILLSQSSLVNLLVVSCMRVNQHRAALHSETDSAFIECNCSLCDLITSLSNITIKKLNGLRFKNEEINM